MDFNIKLGLVSMINKLTRILKLLKYKNENDKKLKEEDNDQRQIPQSMAALRKALERTFYDCNDYILREIDIGDTKEQKLLITYLDGLVDKKIINDNILKPLMIELDKIDYKDSKNKKISFDKIKNKLLIVTALTEINTYKKLVDAVLAGDTVIYLPGNKRALKLSARGGNVRTVEEPTTEAVIRGPREGFTETIRTNTSLLRRKIKSPKLKFENYVLGEKTQTDVAICYIKDLANEDIINTVRKRLRKIKTDAILESGYLEEFIEDAPFSIFATVSNSEKPDIVAAKVLEGRVAILCDGTPFVLTVPHLFIETLSSADDYYSRSIYSTFVRLVRFSALIITTTLPAIYVAMVSFHQDIIPFKLLLTVSASRQGVPLSAFSETFIMLVAFEFMREAGVRMPSRFGQAVSIVGALVLGQSAVAAGIASDPIVMIVALTAVTAFVVQPLREAIPIIRFINLIAANVMGLFWMSLVLFMFIIHLVSLRSFGVPFLAPFAPFYKSDLKDSLIRFPLWAMWRRPRGLENQSRKDNEFRMKKDIKSKED